MTDIERNIQRLKERVQRAAERRRRSPEEITIVAVAKTVGIDAILTAYGVGISQFGENRVQEAKPKIEQLSSLAPDIIWHMVGHLQTNKVKTAVDIFDIIESVDSLKLAEAISLRASKVVPILIQINVVGEETKSGFSPTELLRDVEKIRTLPNLDVRGLMTIGPLISDPEEVRPVFRQLREMRDRLGLAHLSMGMTDDFEVAIEEGATMIRIGRAIFGERKE